MLVRFEVLNLMVRFNSFTNYVKFVSPLLKTIWNMSVEKNVRVPTEIKF